MTVPDLIEFVAMQTGVRPYEITANTTLFGDLSLDGDDAVEFFEEFKKKYGVNLDGYRHNKYFGDEGMWPWEIIRLTWAFLRKIRGEDPHIIAGLEPITITRLVEVANAQCWR